MALRLGALLGMGWLASVMAAPPRGSRWSRRKAKAQWPIDVEGMTSMSSRVGKVGGRKARAGKPASPQTVAGKTRTTRSGTPAKTGVNALNKSMVAAQFAPRAPAKKATGPINMTGKAPAGKTAKVLVLSPARGKRTLSHRQIENAVRRVMSERSSADG